MCLCKTKGCTSISPSRSYLILTICRNVITSNAYLAINFSVVKNVSVWISYDLDHILDQGDRVIKALNKWIFRSHYKLMGFLLNVIVESVNGSDTFLALPILFFLQKKKDLFENIKHYSDEEWYNGVIFTCDRLSEALIWLKDSFFSLWFTKSKC